MKKGGGPERPPPRRILCLAQMPMQRYFISR